MSRGMVKQARGAAEPVKSKHSTAEPLKCPWPKAELPLRLGIRSATQARRVVDGIATECGQGLLLCD